MTHAPSPLVDRTRASHAARDARVRGLARGAALAGVAVLAAALAACSTDDAQASALPPPDPAASHVGAPVPPPPVIAALPVATTTVAAAGNAASAAADAAAADETSSSFDPRRLDSVRANLDAELARGASCSADSECRTVAVGGKACGGPTGYRAYSTKGADPKAVESLAADERRLSLQQARASGRVSPCFMLADPGAHCQAHKCVTGPAGGLAGNGRRVPEPPSANASAVR